MGSARGLANHSLYMARILIETWGGMLDRDEGPGSNILEAAFGPAVRGHLLDAYGWFLLAMTRTVPLPEAPPHRTDELPNTREGIAEPGEIREYRNLEQEGWLARLQALPERGVARPVPAGRLASSSSRPHIGDYRDWCEQFDQLFSRMADCMDEY
ncbi:MAG: hypothetical protein L7T24_10270 [Luminiphilus sp.]|nr:hypothetical protein [Luminiphilus sp.]